MMSDEYYSRLGGNHHYTEVVFIFRLYGILFHGRKGFNLVSQLQWCVTDRIKATHPEVYTEGERERAVPRETVLALNKNIKSC
jgi:hypothetical protein